MIIQRDEQGILIIRNEQGEEIHPYLTVLYAIEAQQRLVPPVIPELTSQGWAVVTKVLTEAVETLGSHHKISDKDIIPEDMPKSVETVVSTDIPPPMTVSPRKPQKPVYKTA